MKTREIIGNLMVLGTILIYSFNTNFMKVLMPEWIGPLGLVLARCLMCAVGLSASFSPVLPKIVRGDAISA